MKRPDLDGVQANNSSLILRLLENGSLLSFVILVIVFGVYTFYASSALSPFSINNLLNDTAALAIASAGLSFVILTGGFDMSVGGVVVLSNVLIAQRGGNGFSASILSLIIVILVGAVVGVVNGLLITRLNIQPIAATLATMIMVEGIALVIMPQPGGTVPMTISLGLTKLLGGFLPVSGLVLVLFVVAWFVVKRTPFGTWLYAIGADERAAKQAGVPVRTAKFAAYVVAGGIYAVGGYFLSAQITSGNPTGGNTMLLLAFAAVAIGGTSFTGGRGGLLGSVIGAAILTVLQKMLFAIGVSSYFTNIFQGAILVVAVLIGGISVYVSKSWQRVSVKG